MKPSNFKILALTQILPNMKQPVCASPVCGILSLTATPRTPEHTGSRPDVPGVASGHPEGVAVWHLLWASVSCAGTCADTSGGPLAAVGVDSGFAFPVASVQFHVRLFCVCVRVTSWGPVQWSCRGALKVTSLLKSTDGSKKFSATKCLASLQSYSRGHCQRGSPQSLFSINPGFQMLLLLRSNY